MKISSQTIIVGPTYLGFVLKSPFMYAWKKFNWTEQVVGFGVSDALLNKCIKADKNLRVIYKGFNYEVTPKEITSYIGHFNTLWRVGKGTVVRVFPQTLFTQTARQVRIEQKEEKQVGLMEVDKSLAERLVADKERIFGKKV